MDCCAQTHAIGDYFDASKAQSEVKQYLGKGLASHARAMLDVVRASGIDGAHVLEVGSGIGSLHLEMLKHGASRATSVEVSPAYPKAAQALAGQFGFADLIDYHLVDFACHAESLPVADLVVMHRVLCCYPDMAGLVAAGARHARRALALRFPRDQLHVRLYIELQAAWMRLRGSRFRNYLHSPGSIKQAAESSGLRVVHEHFSGMWQIVVFERAA